MIRPKMYGLLKLHKPQNLLRPILSIIKSPTQIFQLHTRAGFPKLFFQIAPFRDIKKSIPP